MENIGLYDMHAYTCVALQCRYRHETIDSVYCKRIVCSPSV